MNKIKLGEEVKDRVTGFQGIAVSRTTYLQGCDRIGVQPKAKKDMTLPDIESFDDVDLVVTGKGITEEKEEIKDPGGPRAISLKPRRFER
jgi:hypothetical protein